MDHQVDKRRTRVRATWSAILIFPFVFPAIGMGADTAPMPDPSSRYYWKSQPVDDSAQLITLFCRSCGDTTRYAKELPLLAVLRDTLNDDSRESDRVTYVWLLSSTHHNVGQQLLAAIPFFYWRVGDGSTHVDEKESVKPLLDLTRPEQPMSVQVLREVLQWTVLDPLSMPVRATSRAYRTNEVSRDRANLEEAIGYLRQAPQSNPGQGLTKSETDTIIARLALRKSLLGGLVPERYAERVGQQENAAQESIRTRNWDLLRSFAEKTGLFFEPLAIAGTSGEYAMLWFPLTPGAAEPVGSSHSAIWKALNLRNPWIDTRLQTWERPVYQRWLDADGSLLPPAASGVRKIQLVPLGAYSLKYPKFPLLVIDFRDKLHLRRDEMTQRAINEVTSGVIGISHFANWYYYAGAGLYDFIASRHGRGMDAALRLDSYSQFRSALALDNELEPELRSLLQRRIDSVSLNPLEGSPEHEVRVAEAQYQALLNSISSGKLSAQLDKTRAAERRDFGKTQAGLTGQAFLRTASLNLFRSRAKSDEQLNAQLQIQRRVQADLAFLQAAASAGSTPEIPYSLEHLRAAVQDLSPLLPDIKPKRIRADAASTLQRLGELTRDSDLQDHCSFALARLNQPRGRNSSLGIQAAPKAVTKARRPTDLHK